MQNSRWYHDGIWYEEGDICTCNGELCKIVTVLKGQKLLQIGSLEDLDKEWWFVSPNEVKVANEMAKILYGDME